MRYAIMIEKGPRNFSAYCPDVPGCVATGKTMAEVKQQICEALEFHLEGLLLEGEAAPAANTQCTYADIDLARIEKGVRRKGRVSTA